MAKYQFNLKEIEMSQIEINPENPRGKNVRDNDAQFQYLKRSIEQFGLIVPIIVQKIRKTDKKYRLLDGERRYWALKELGVKTVRANTVKNKIGKDEAKNIMFHIHTNRLQWNPFQQCRALEPIYKQLKKEYRNDENKIANQLVLMTSTNKRTIQDRLNFLQWPEKVRKDVYEKHPDLYWTVAEIENGIIKPAERNFPEYFRKVSKDQVRQILFNKYVEGYIYVATDARKVKYIVKTTKENKEQHRYALSILKKLVENIDYTFDEAQEEFLSKFPEAEKAYKISYKRIKNQIIKMVSILRDYNLSSFKLLRKKEKKGFESILQELETAIDDFKKEYYTD